jgi:hypothetical protein
MDMARSEVRKLAAEEYSTAQHLEHAAEQARTRNYQDFLIVDVDAHHYESESYKEVFEYIENPVIRRQAVESAKRGGRASMLGGTIGYQDIGGRTHATSCAGTTSAGTISLPARATATSE